MLTTKALVRRYGGNVCRSCINEETGVHLKPSNCVYDPSYAVCPRCRRRYRHIVVRFRPSGLLKLIGRRPKLRR